MHPYSLTFFILFFALHLHAQEICDNAKDDDGDGLVDMKDNECFCKDSLPVVNYLHNPSFEDILVCPHDAWGDGLGLNHFPYWSSAPEKGQISYYNLDCQYKYFDTFPPPNPLPDGKGYILISNFGDIQYGNKYYAATCLKNTLKANHKYSFECYIAYSTHDKNHNYFKNSTKLTLFGSADCSGVQFTNFISMGCPTIVSPWNNYQDWVQLGMTNVSATDSWVKARIDFIPSRDINLLLVGPDCANLGNGYQEYYYADMFSLSEEENFAFKTISVNNDCVNDIVLTAPVATDVTYQWYKDSVAIIGAKGINYTVLKNAPKGNYNVKLQFNDYCIFSSVVTINPDAMKGLTLGNDTTLCIGENLVLEANIPDMKYLWQDGSTNRAIGVDHSGNYSVKVFDGFGCNTSEDINVEYKECTDCPIQLPSAFTPNNDGINDIFKTLTTCSLVKNFYLVIYNRWGQKIFETKDISKGWNGTFNAQPLPIGTYVYILQYKKYNTRIAQTKGVVTLIR